MKLKSILLAGCAVLASAAIAQAADLPTKKGAPLAPAKIACWDSFWTWFDNSAADCPLSQMGVTFYGQIDVGVGYETNASRLNKNWAQGVSELVSNTSRGARFQFVPNGLSQSNVGIKWKEQISGDWYFIGDVNFGFDPYTLHFADSPKSLVDNNTTALINRTANGDSSRAYGPINTRAFAGVSNKTFGTLTYGRQYAFSNDNDNTYDPMGGSYAFSLIGYTSTIGGGLGDTELARFNNSIKYVYADHGVRVGVLSQVGGWSAGNNAKYAIQGDIGFDWQGFSFDGVYSYAKDAVSLGVWSSAAGSAPPAPLASTTVKATIQNISALQLAAKYKYDKFTFFAGYQLEHFTDPSDLPAFNQVGRFNDGLFALYGGNAGGAAGLGGTGGQGNAFPVPKNTQVVWTGAKWAVLPTVDLAFGYYHVWQNNFLGATQTATSCVSNASLPAATRATSGGVILQGTSSNKCAGSEDAISGLVDWHATKRLDVYAGAMFSKVRAGLASGFLSDNNLATTAGLRLSF